MALLLAPTVEGGCRERPSEPPGGAQAPPAAWPSVPLEGFVVLPFGSHVYVEPRFGSVASRLGGVWMTMPPWPNAGYVARVVGSRDGFVEIAPLLEPGPQHCGPRLEGDAFDVRLYVSPWSLGKVLVTTVEEQQDDGTRLLVGPGAVVEAIPDDPAGHWAVVAGGIRVHARLPPDAVGLAYSTPADMTMPSERPWEVPYQDPLRYANWPLRVTPGFGQDVAVVSVAPMDAQHVLELASPCARVVAFSDRAPVSWNQHVEPFPEFGLGAPEPAPAPVLAAAGLEPEVDETVAEVRADAFELVDAFASGSGDEAAQLSAFGSSIGGFGIVGSGPGTEHAFEEGAPVYLSAAGPAAGTLSRLRVFSEEAWAAGDRLCFHTAFGSHFDPALPVCLPAAEARVRNPVTDVHDFSPVTVRPASLEITGALPEDAVAGALRRHRNDVRRCVVEASMAGIPAAGELALALSVGKDGTLTRVEPRSPRVEPLTDCVVAAAKQWVMPAPRDDRPATVVFSVTLQSLP